MKIKPLINFLMLCSLLGFTNYSNSQNITAYGTIWPPYIDSNLPGHGLATSIVDITLKRAGYFPSYIFRNWDQVLESSDNDENPNLVIAIWKNSKRAESYFFSEPYLNNEIFFLKQKKDQHIQFKTISDLRGLRVGVVHDYAYSDMFDNDKTITKVAETHILANILQLFSGGIDITVGDERTLRYEVNRHFKDDKNTLEFIPEPLAVRSLHVAVPKDHPEAYELLERFNESLQSILEDGTYSRILRQSNEEIWRRSYLTKQSK